MSEFLERRRQPFLSENYFEAYQKYCIENGFPERLVDLASGRLDARDFLGVAYGLAKTRTNVLRLRYTAGISVDQLRSDLDEIVADWERYAEARRQFKEDPLWSAFSFGDRVDYNTIIQLVGLAILLKRQDLLSRIDGLCHIYQGDDAIYDELLSPFLPDRPQPESLFHPDPYEIALDAIDEEDPVEQADLMKEAVERWYPANEGQPFHDTHKQIDDDGSGGYFGYWCFELAALTVILGIDDSTFRDHVTYPKDLADFARPKPAATPEAELPVRPYTGVMAFAGDPCPETGRWQAPRLNHRIEQVERGQPMPGPKNTQTGAVIWYLLKA